MVIVIPIVWTMAGVSNPSGKDPSLLANLVKESLGALKTRYNQDLNKLVSVTFYRPPRSHPFKFVDPHSLHLVL